MQQFSVSCPACIAQNTFISPPKNFNSYYSESKKKVPWFPGEKSAA
jgi:hypothetical protein